MDRQLKEILEKKNLRLENIPEGFLSLVEKAQGSVFDRIVELINSLEVKNGHIVQSTANLKIVEQIGKELLLTDEYKSSLKRFAKEFDIQADLNNQYFALIDKSFEPSEFTKSLLEQAKRKAINLLTGASVEAGFINPVKDNLENAVKSGSSLSDTIKSIREIALGKEGRLVRYSRQIAFDSFAIYDRSYSKAASEDLGLEWYFYSGGLKDTSRPFCRANNEKYFHKSEIEMFGEGLDLDGKPLSEEKLRGRIKGTNKDNIFSVLGGHLCAHSLMPVSIVSVPKSVAERNIKAGRFKPSRQEKELFAL